VNSIVKMALAVVVGSALVVGVYWFLVPHEVQVCPECQGTGARSCPAPGCLSGRAPCRGDCIKRDNPNWQISSNPHFPPNTLTLRYQNEDGSAAEVSQSHVGQTMTVVNGRWSLGGPCAVCGGTNRMICPACSGKLVCPVCKGKKEVPK
jgi:hypothetical protein